MEAELEHLWRREVLFDATQRIGRFGYCEWDYVNGRIKSCTEEYARIFGMSTKEVIESQDSWEKVLEQIHPDDRETYTKSYQSQFSEGSHEIEYRFFRKDGEIRYAKEIGVVFYDNEGNEIDSMGLVQDITEQKTIEQYLLESRVSLEAIVEERTGQLADTIVQLEQENAERKLISSEMEKQNAELERFAYTVSHDLKTPLVTINGFLGLLAKDIVAKDESRITNNMAVINEAAKTMGTLLDNLLELSRIGRVVGELEACDLTKIVGHAIDQVKIRIDEQETEIVIENMPEVIGDEIRLVEVFVNLIENAIKFMGAQKAPRVLIGSVEKGGMVCCFVRDNGVGIAAEFHDQVFGLFNRLDTAVEGTGVGLALVKRIVEVHGGEIWLESEGIGRGSKLSFTLPKL